MEARKKLKKQEEKNTVTITEEVDEVEDVPIKSSKKDDDKIQKNKFVRVAIEEDSSEEEQEDKGDEEDPKIEDSSESKPRHAKVVKSKAKPKAARKTKLPMKNQSEIDKHN